MTDIVIVKSKLPETLWRAARLRAALHEQEMQGVVQAALESYLAPELAELRERGLAGAAANGGKS